MSKWFAAHSDSDSSSSSSDSEDERPFNQAAQASFLVSLEKSFSTTISINLSVMKQCPAVLNRSFFGKFFSDIHDILTDEDSSYASFESEIKFTLKLHAISDER